MTEMLSWLSVIADIFSVNQIIDYMTRRFRDTYTDEAQHYRGLTGKVKNRLVTVNGLAGKPWVLVFMWMPLGTHHCSPAWKNHRTKNTQVRDTTGRPKRFCAHASMGQSQVRFTATTDTDRLGIWGIWRPVKKSKSPPNISALINVLNNVTVSVTKTFLKTWQRA